MKRIVTLLVIVGLCHLKTFSQKKYEMVVEKTDGTETVFNVEDIVRTFFRERTDEPDDENQESNFLVGEWQECDALGNLYNDATGTEVMHMNIISNDKGEWWSVTKGEKNTHWYSFDYTYSFSGNYILVTQTITASSNLSEIGMSGTMQCTYDNGILHGGEIYYKKISESDSGGGNEGGNSSDDTATLSPGSAVDLGLSVYWASCNVGSNSPEEIGGYYAWGETAEKDLYGDNYAYSYSESSFQDIGIDISGTQYDVAKNKWGGAWRMPTFQEWKELVDRCTWAWTSQNGVNGVIVTGPNGNHIFLPAGGRKYGSRGLRDLGEYGCYWTSTICSNDGTNYSSHFLLFYNNNHDFEGRNRINGMTIRPVTNDATGIIK